MIFSSRLSLWALVLCNFVLLNLVFLPSGLQAQVDKFEPGLVRALNQAKGPVPVIVTLEPVAPPTTGLFNDLTPAEMEYYLRVRSAERQWRLRQLVNDTVSNSRGSDISQFMYFWSTNAMMATATAEVLWEIAQLPEVKSLAFDAEIRLSYRRDEEVYSSEFTYGLERIGIPELRYEYPHLTGRGVVVGVLDTGIDSFHNELRDKVVAWKDFILDRSEPYDDEGHGTHVAGTIAGEGRMGTQFGVAPGVSLVVGKILDHQGRGRLSGIIRGMDWIANPERKLSSQLRPRVVNNSWGGVRSGDARRDPFAQAVVNWIQLEIFPVFAAGNSGPNPNTTGSPGALPEAFAVGATDENDVVTGFSSRGPVRIIDLQGRERELIKPDISAPGARVFSTLPGGRYGTLSGTSMAAPHVAGAAALLYQFNPRLRVADVQRLLMESALDLGVEGPDNSYGAGRMNIYKAIQMHP